MGWSTSCTSRILASCVPTERQFLLNQNSFSEALRNWSSAAVIFGIAVHWRIYPVHCPRNRINLTFKLFVERAAKVIYVPVIALHLSWQKFIGHENMAFSLFCCLLRLMFQMKWYFQRPSCRSGGFGAVSLTTFASLGLICYSLYGMEFLECAYLHHGHLMQYHWTSIGSWHSFFFYNLFLSFVQIWKDEDFSMFLGTSEIPLEVLKLLIWAGKRRDPQHNFSATRTQKTNAEFADPFFFSPESGNFLPQLFCGSEVYFYLVGYFEHDIARFAVIPQLLLQETQRCNKKQTYATKNWKTRLFKKQSMNRRIPGSESDTFFLHL